MVSSRAVRSRRAQHRHGDRDAQQRARPLIRCSVNPARWACRNRVGMRSSSRFPVSTARSCPSSSRAASLTARIRSVSSAATHAVVARSTSSASQSTGRSASVAGRRVERLGRAGGLVADLLDEPAPYHPDLWLGRRGQSSAPVGEDQSVLDQLVQGRGTGDGVGGHGQHQLGAVTGARPPRHQLVGGEAQVQHRPLLLQQRQRRAGRRVPPERPRVVVGELQEVLAQQRLRVLQPGRDQEQRYVGQLDRDGSGIGAAPRVVDAALGGRRGQVAELEPDDLALAAPLGAPSVDRLLEQLEAATGPGDVSKSRERGRWLLAVGDLHPHEADVQVRGQLDRGPAVQQGVGDDLADGQLGVLGEVAPADVREPLADRAPRGRARSRAGQAGPAETAACPPSRDGCTAIAP